MTATRDGARLTGNVVPRDCTLVWVDAREAIVSRWHAGEIFLAKYHSDVPPHHRSTGHVRHDPTVRHGGSAPHDTGEANRLEHLARFIESVASCIDPDDDLVIVGPGTVRDRLEHLVRETDRQASRARPITCHAAARMTDRQLIARLREAAGAEGRKPTVGDYEWVGSRSRHTSGMAPTTSDRVASTRRPKAE